MKEKTEIIERIQSKLNNKEYVSIKDDLENIKKSIQKKSEDRNRSTFQKRWHIFWIGSNDQYKFQNNYAEYLDRDNESTIEQLLHTLGKIQYFNSEDIINIEFKSMTTKQKNQNPQKIIKIRVDCTFKCSKAGYQNLSYSCEKQQNECFIKKLNEPKDPKKP